MAEGEYNTSLSESCSVALLISLYNAERPMKIVELEKVLPNYYALRKRIAMFDGEELVIETLAMDPRKVVYISLTDKGRKVASVLSDIVKFLPAADDLVETSICMKYAEPILVMLLRNGKLCFNDILTVFPNYTPIVKKLFPALEKDGLVKILERDTSLNYNPSTIELTTLGKMIATGLDEVHSLIKTEPDSDD